MDVASVLASGDRYFLTDGGLETWLIFHRRVALREFASFELIHSESGKQILSSYFDEYITLATQFGKGFIMDTPTWRANADWCQKLGFDLHEMEEINADAAQLMRSIRAQRGADIPVIVNGVVGPRGDGYVADASMDARAAQSYHAGQIGALRRGGVDMITALTMTNVDESIGICRAANAVDLPVVISYTVETDGALPSGQSLGDAIAAVDQATNGGPVYFMINCAHPDHFRDAIDRKEPWIGRIGGVRANASRMSHQELDAAEVLDEGNPEEFGALNEQLTALLPRMRVMGGCCGTDLRHVGSIFSSVFG